jgi:structural maintenance of chromosome 2
MELAEHELELLNRDLESGTSATVLSKQQERASEVEQLKQQIVQDEETIGHAQEHITQIEKDMAEFKSDKGSKLNELREQIQALKASSQTQSVTVKEHLSQFQTSQVDFESAENEVQSCRDQIKEKATIIADLNKSLENIKTQFESGQIAAAEALDALEAENKALSGIDDEVGTVESLLATKKKFTTDSKLEAQQLKHEVEKSKSTVDSVEAHIKSLETDFEWITEQAQYFGQTGTQYDYHKVNMAEAKANLKRLRDRIKGMKKNVNPKVMNMIESVEKKEESLQGMIQTIEKDKTKIEDTIETLDDYKRKALIKTWEKVSVDFGKVFGDLLPKSYAKLVPPEGKDVTDGLEVKVALGGVWKDGLAELSGGQRSLIALSLILALLQFKPAPMYILDEVDAALDPHHTQNIGHIIKTRFQGSQFIVVSLKDGMFTNANRVFRTRFQEGTSTVSVM